MNTPSTKVTAATLAVAVGIIVVYGIESVGDIDLPTAVEGAITTIFAFLTGYFVPEKNPPQSARDTIAAEQRDMS